jgi:hypothetical protein
MMMKATQATTTTKENESMAINTNDHIFSNVAATLNLVEVTTERQRTNGTRAFIDDSLEDAALYTVHPNGYVRRQTGNGSRYQLNRKSEATRDNGLTRILSNSANESAGILFRGVTNYRQFCGMES